MKGGMPVIQVRDMTVQRRENDLVLATFGRGFYILDDYSALREISQAALAEEARLFPLRNAYLFSQTGLAPAGTAGIGSLSGNWTTENPPFGAVFTYNVAADLPADARLVLTINDESGKQVRRMDVEKTAGLRRVVWNLRMDPPAAPARPSEAEPATGDDAGGQAAQAGQAGQQGGRGAGAAQIAQAMAGLGRGGQQAALVVPGRYQAVLGKQVGDKVTPLGPPQSFHVVQIPQ